MALVSRVVQFCAVGCWYVTSWGSHNVNNANHKQKLAWCQLRGQKAAYRSTAANTHTQTWKLLTCWLQTSFCRRWKGLRCHALLCELTTIFPEPLHFSDVICFLMYLLLTLIWACCYGPSCFLYSTCCYSSALVQCTLEGLTPWDNNDKHVGGIFSAVCMLLITLLCCPHCCVFFCFFLFFFFCLHRIHTHEQSWSADWNRISISILSASWMGDFQAAFLKSTISRSYFTVATL